MRELDLPLERYLDGVYPSAGPSARQAFLRLLDEPDDRLRRYLYGGLSPKDPILEELLRDIRRAAAARP